MEKRISYAQFQSVKAVAKACDPIQRKIEPLRRKINALLEECQAYERQISAIEQGIVEVIGFHVSDLVKKVVETKGTDPKTGKLITSTKWLPTDKVRYDDTTKVYVVRVDEEHAPKTARKEEEEEERKEETATAPMAEEGDAPEAFNGSLDNFMPAEPESIFD